MTEAELLLAIQDLLDGVEWTADTAAEIARLMSENGYAIRDFDDDPDISRRKVAAGVEG